MAIYQEYRIADTKTLYISGQTPVQEGRTPESIEKQLDSVLEKMNLILLGNQLTVEDLVKLTIYITDRDYLGAVRLKCSEYLKGFLPAMTLVIVDGLVDEEFKVEIDGIASFK